MGKGLKWKKYIVSSIILEKYNFENTEKFQGADQGFLDRPLGAHIYKSLNPDQTLEKYYFENTEKYQEPKPGFLALFIEVWGIALLIFLKYPMKMK